MKQLITVNRSGNGKFFLMDNSCGVDGRPKGQLPGTPYYDMSQKNYEELTSNG